MHCIAVKVHMASQQEASIQQDQDPQNALAALITMQYILPVLGLTCAHINLEAFSHICWLQMGPIAEEQGGPLHVTTSCATAVSASQHGSSTATTAACAAESASGRHERGSSSSSSSSATEQQQAQAGEDAGSGMAAWHVVLTQTVRVQLPSPEAVLAGYGTGLGEQELREDVEDVATDTVNLQESLSGAVQLEGFDATAAAAAAVVTVL